MNTLKLTILICLAFISQTLFAGEWNHISLKKDDYFVRISYTKQYLPATYGHHGGITAGLFYVDVYSERGFKAESGSINSINFQITENTPTHSWAQIKGNAYAYPFMGQNAQLNLVIDGRVVTIKFKMI